MKKILVFAVDSVTGNKLCNVYREPIDLILERYESPIEWAKFIFHECKTIEVVDVKVVDEVAIRCSI